MHACLCPSPLYRLRTTAVRASWLKRRWPHTASWRSRCGCWGFFESLQKSCRALACSNICAPVLVLSLLPAAARTTAAHVAAMAGKAAHALCVCRWLPLHSGSDGNLSLLQLKAELKAASEERSAYKRQVKLGKRATPDGQGQSAAAHVGLAASGRSLPLEPRHCCPQVHCRCRSSPQLWWRCFCS